jgi:transcriptional regulator with XRE-family HTH domain
MPRPPTHYSIIREIRTKIGLTQGQLALRLGVSRITINQIENGMMPKFSRRLALSLSNLTGVPYRDIMDNRPGPLQTWHGELSSSKLEQLDRMARDLAPRQLRTLIGNAEYRAELILTAAAEHAPQKLWTLDAAIEANFDELEKEFGLQKDIERLRRTPAPFADWIKAQVGSAPAGLFDQARKTLSGHSMEDRAAKKLAALKKKLPISSRAKSSKRRKHRGS